MPVIALDDLPAALPRRGALLGLDLGLPLNLDGTEGPRAQSTRAFARNLVRLAAQRGWAEPVIALWDERLSTAAVNRMLIAHVDMTRARRAEVVDKAAAAYILQGALERLRGLGDAG